MPLYRFETRMGSDIPNQPPRKWRNTWYNESANALTTAAMGVGLWVAYLRNAARPRVWCYEVYAVDINPATDDYASLPVPVGSQRGLAADPPTDLEPYLAKVCMAVTLIVPGSRPSRKFWRPGLYEGDVTNGTTINPELVTLIEGNLNGFITGNPGLLVDPDNEPILQVGKVSLTTREFGRESTADVPAPPPLPA